MKQNHQTVNPLENSWRWKLLNRIKSKLLPDAHIVTSGQKLYLNINSGDKIDVDGVGERFNGVYYVEEVSHESSPQGYAARFTVKRDEDV